MCIYLHEFAHACSDVSLIQMFIIQIRTSLLIFKFSFQLIQANNAAAALSANTSVSGDKTDKFVEAKLRDLVQRQSRLIAELKRQCLMVTEKLVRIRLVFLNLFEFGKHPQLKLKLIYQILRHNTNFFLKM